ncbi:MAG: penicillin acylase family protein [Gammaproteobacteria bacterium]|nr:penicillin acylase family protein [Gammaproteobacteria bacterium]
MRRSTGLGVGGCALLVTIGAFAGETTSSATVEYAVPGLEAPADIRVDEWGIPHIRAATHYDAYYVQGFNAARDRLWQIDLWRLRGLGELSSVLGAKFIEQDRAARLFLYRGDLYREWLAYGSDAKRITQHFVAGINAYIQLTRMQPDLLPPEFGLLGYAPAQWHPADVVRIRGHGLWRNVEDEVKRARVLCQSDARADGVRSRLEPTWTVQIPDSFEPCSFAGDVLRDYRLAKAPVHFTPAAAGVTPHSTATDSRLGMGSNNWAVAPQRTATGRPILADDPHRAHAVPALRYMVHLTAPGLNVIGAGEPSLPGISIGHNGTIAFGLTIFPIDQEDLYVYDTNAKGTHYRYRGEWLAFEKLTESLSVRDAAATTVSLEFTRHGPVVARDPSHRKAFAVRAAWLEPGMAPYFGSVEYMRARNWREFVGALNRWGAPSENQVYADTDGNIGYKPAGLFPRRDNWDGLLPVPGDGRYEWNGYFDMDALPEEFNPSRGFVATANAMNLPTDFPIDTRRVGFEWSAPWRHQRLHEVLANQPHHTLADSLSLQRDYGSVLARQVLAVLPALPRSPAVDLLSAWDATLARDSAAAALYMVWAERFLGPLLKAYLVPHVDDALIAAVDSRVIAEFMGKVPAELLPAIAASLDDAWADTARELGEDSARWRWGSLHQMRFVHPLLELAPPRLAAQMAYPAYARGGSADTPNNTGFRDPSSFDVASGASFRMVLDVGNWDAARMTNAPGQSGDPRSPFYANLLPGWAADESFPLIYSESAIASHTVLTIHLRPQEDAP